VITEEPCSPLEAAARTASMKISVPRSLPVVLSGSVAGGFGADGLFHDATVDSRQLSPQPPGGFVQRRFEVDVTGGVDV